jgi:DNA-binding GntR family transcriptional regulator
MNQTSKPGRTASITSVLESEIESGKLPPGELLDERKLAERFGVSRTPVREALQKLAVQNLVQIVPRQGVVVSRMSVTQLREMLELLGELEGLTAKLAARRINDEQRSRLQAAIEQCASAVERDDSRGFTEANAAYHETIYEASCNRYLTDQIHTIRRLIGRYRPRLFDSPARRQKSLDEHRKLAAAICAGDEAGSESLAVEHAPVGRAGFSEFLATLPYKYLAEETGSALATQRGSSTK